MIKKNNNNNGGRQRQSPITIKISKKMLYMILAISIINLVVASITLIISIFTPFSINAQLTSIGEQVKEFERKWQNSGIDSDSSDTKVGEVGQKPDITDAVIQEELATIEKSMIEALKEESIAPAIKELDASAYIVKGQLNNVDLDSVKESESTLDLLKSENGYITKVFYGTNGENFVSVPGVDMSKAYNPCVLPWYTDAESGKGKVQWSKIRKDSFTGEYTMTGSIAIQVDVASKNIKRTIGVLGVEVSLSKIK